MPEAAAHVAADAVSLGLPPEERRRAFPSNQLVTDQPSEMPNEKQRKALPSKPIEVVAMRDGYYAPNRIPARAQFMVRQFSHLQSWMKCTDPEMQELHQKAQDDRKTKMREAQLRMNPSAEE